MTPDDYGQIGVEMEDKHSCGCLDEIVHEAVELIIDPGSQELSASRLGSLWINGLGTVGALVLIVCGIKYNLSWTGIPAATIITGLASSNALVYWGSSKKGYKCNCGE